MAAAATPSLIGVVNANTAPPTVAAILAFLQAAATVFSAAWSEHEDIGDGDDRDDTANTRLVALLSNTSASHDGNRLRADLCGVNLPPPNEATPASDEDAIPLLLFQQCRKLGLDIVLRLDHLAARRQRQEEDAATGWSLEDLVVLGERLDTLIQRVRDLENCPFPANELSRLEKQLVCRHALFAPPCDEYYHLDTTSSSSNGAGQGQEKDPYEEQRKQSRALRQNIHPANQPRQVPADILQDFILEGLAYKSMHDRADEVTEAYASTFDWVFADASEPSSSSQGHTMKHSVKKWLTTTEAGPIYWITGKPGSGKSTFIRYLFQHEATMECLQDWSGAQQPPCLVAGFFFWTSGSREQRSQTGLLRSLLHQLLSAHPEYIATSFPTLWEKLCAMPTKERIKLRLDWTVEELLPAFLTFISTASAKMKICLFVDGMDEFEGDHADIIKLFKSLATGPGAANVKMCLSSRPWAVFQDAFEFAVPNLKLQELTYGDMQQYVSETLQQSNQVRAILQRDAAKGHKFLQSVIERADGVFLWVRLAVDKILERFIPSKGMEGLGTLLQTLPSDLDELFAKLLFEDQTADQLQQSASLYSLMRAREEVADFVRNDSANNLTVWELAFALDKADNRLVIDKLPVEEVTDDYIQERGEATIATVNQRFAGLLDFHFRKREGNLRIIRGKKRKGRNEPTARDKARSRIVYIHRTVRDWLVFGTGIHEKLMTQLAPDFDPNLRLLRSYILQMKRPLGIIEHHRMLDDWWPGITLALTHARYITHDPETLQRPFVNELSETIGWWWEAKPHDPYDHWARNAYGAFELRMKRPPIWQPFLCLAVKFGLRNYVREELAARRARDESGDLSDEMRALQVADAVPLLAYATEFLCSRKKTIYPLSDPGLVEDLLSSVCRINPGVNHWYVDFASNKDTTPWQALLRHLRDARRRRWIKLYDVDETGTQRWAKVVSLFLEVGGADADAHVEADIWDPAITADGVMDLLDETYFDAEIRGVKDLLHGLKKGKGKEITK